MDSITEKSRLILDKVYQTAKKLNFEVFAVGGFVRDLLIGSREGTDIDFVVIGDALKFAEQFQQMHGSGKVVTFPRFATAMLNYNEFKLEFVSARSEHYDPGSRKPHVEKADLKSDLSRRDFTINTLAMNISPDNFGEIIDEFQGKKDIEAGIIKTPLDPVVTFNDDPLRILRAIRFASQLNFTIEAATLEAVKETRERLRIISQERITEEFRKIMASPVPSVGLNLLKETGLNRIIFPELEMLAGVEQRQDYHHKDVFNHTLKVVDNISQRTDKIELRMAALLHDIAKPQTKRFVEGVGWTFHGHEELGAKMTERIGRRMRLPIAEIKYIKKLVRLHLRPMQLVDEAVTDSAIRRVMVETGEDIEDLMILCRADITSKNPDKVKKYLQNFDIVEEKMKIVEEKDKLRNFRPAIDGNEIMNLLNIRPGPIIGIIKQKIVDAILDGEIPNEKQACLDYLMKMKDEFISFKEN